MRVTGSRLMPLIAAIAIVACSDATSPQDATESNAPAVTPAPSTPATPLQSIGESLVDATDWVLVAIPDDGVRVKMKSAIKQLADDLVTGRNADAKTDVSALRSSLTSLQDLGPALGPIGVALDQIDSEFGKSAE